MASDTTPGDSERPRPRYGEMAPDGWSWKPPQPDELPGGAGNSAAPPPPPPGPPASPAQPTGQAPWTTMPAQPTTSRAPGWDLAVTVSLIVVGLLGTFLAILVLAATPQAVQQLYTQEGLGAYTPAASVPGVVTAGSITLAGVWLASTIVAILLMTRGKRAFYVPLIGGVVSFVTIFAFMIVILTTDPTLFDYFSRP
jgi:hypothetical protein